MTEIGCTWCAGRTLACSSPYCPHRETPDDDLSAPRGIINSVIISSAIYLVAFAVWWLA
jgi:hypothetical protein